MKLFPKQKSSLILGLILGGCILAHPVFAESQDSPLKNGPSQKLKGKAPREKEAEGTQAPNRFGTDTIVKSKYELNGQPLEVDTD